MKRTTKRILCAALILAACLTSGGCDLLLTLDEGKSDAAEKPSAGHLPVTKESAPTGLTDVASLYEENGEDVVCFYVTVLGGSAADGTNHTLAEVDSYLNLQGMQNVEKIRTGILLQIGDEEGPREGEIGYTAVAGNATMNVRGRTSTGYSQKSYRIDLYEGAGLWRGQRAIALNKHPVDVTRLRNALYFRLLEEVPSLPSLRTQFVHLYVKDRTAEKPSDAFVDYGLFTQVELPNGRYLRNHGLSIGGNLYKANLCEMYRYPDALRLATDPAYDAAAFSEILEPKTGEDHTKLLAMLDAVNDYSRPIEDVLGTYFDVDNLTSYLAFNLLMGNPDSDAQNYLLYSPVDSDRWYYLCWDGDACLRYSEYDILGRDWEEGAWTHGVSNYWGVVLFRRALRLASFREALSAKVEALHEIITPEHVAELVAGYRKIVDPFVGSSPDSANLRVTAAQREKILAALPRDVETAYRYYKESLERPMPFFQGDAYVRDGELILSWDDSYDFDGEFLRYDVALCADWRFENVLFEKKGLLSSSVSLPLPEAGEYYWRVTVRNESGMTQTSFDSVTTSTGYHQGMRRFLVGADGTVVNPQ